MNHKNRFLLSFLVKAIWNVRSNVPLDRITLLYVIMSMPPWQGKRNTKYYMISSCEIPKACNTYTLCPEKKETSTFVRYIRGGGKPLAVFRRAFSLPPVLRPMRPRPGPVCFPSNPGACTVHLIELATVSIIHVQKIVKIKITIQKLWRESYWPLFCGHGVVMNFSEKVKLPVSVNKPVQLKTLPKWLAEYLSYCPNDLNRIVTPQNFQIY